LCCTAVNLDKNKTAVNGQQYSSKVQVSSTGQQPCIASSNLWNGQAGQAGQGAQGNTVLMKHNHTKKQKTKENDEATS
jgi:hypothetical protein